MAAKFLSTHHPQRLSASLHQERLLTISLPRMLAFTVSALALVVQVSFKVSAFCLSFSSIRRVPVVYTLILSPNNAHEPYLGKIRFDDIIFSTCHFRKFEFRLTFCFTQRTRERTISPLWVSHSCSTNIRVYSPFQRTIHFRSSMVLKPLAKSQKPAEFLFLSPLPCRP